MAQTNVAGTWLATTDIFGNPLHQRLTLEANGSTLSGKLGNDKLEGTVNRAGIRFMTKNDSRGSRIRGTVTSDSMTGTVVTIDGDTKTHTNETCTAIRVVERHPGPPARHEFVPTTFYCRFSPDTKRC
jgi:hypothetical protein